MSKTRAPSTKEKQRCSRPGQQKRSRAAVNEKMPRWRRILVLLALLGFLVFFAPVLGGIVNIANLLAMGGFVLLAMLFLFLPAFLRLLRWLWARRWGKALVLAVGSGTGAVALALLVLFCLVATELHAVPRASCPTVLVLGCQVRGTVPSLLLQYRIQAAEDYLTANPTAVAILSGGKGSGENISEAACMYQVLSDRGIDPQRLYLEEASSNTWENLCFSQALMEREGLSGPVAIVSNDFHIYRALQMAGDLGLDAHGLAAKSKYWFSRPTYMLREAMALVQYGLS